MLFDINIEYLAFPSLCAVGLFGAETYRVELRYSWLPFAQGVEWLQKMRFPN